MAGPASFMMPTVTQMAGKTPFQAGAQGAVNAFDKGEELERKRTQFKQSNEKYKHLQETIANDKNAKESILGALEQTPEGQTLMTAPSLSAVGVDGLRGMDTNSIVDMLGKGQMELVKINEKKKKQEEQAKIASQVEEGEKVLQSGGSLQNLPSGAMKDPGFKATVGAVNTERSRLSREKVAKDAAEVRKALADKDTLDRVLKNAKDAQAAIDKLNNQTRLLKRDLKEAEKELKYAISPEEVQKAEEEIFNLETLIDRNNTSVKEYEEKKKEFKVLDTARQKVKMQSQMESNIAPRNQDVFYGPEGSPVSRTDTTAQGDMLPPRPAGTEDLVVVTSPEQTVNMKPGEAVLVYRNGKWSKMVKRR